MMHVAVVGGSDRGGMTLSVTRGFTAVGCRVDLVPYVDWMPKLYRPNVRGSGIAERVMGSIVRPVVEARLLRAIRGLKPNLVFLVKCDDLHRSTLRALRRLGATVFAFHPDDPFNSRRGFAPGPSHRRAATQMGEVDAYFVWSAALVAQAKRRGAHAHYLPFASDTFLHHPVEITAEERTRYEAHVSFIGNWDRERERWLSALVGFDLAIWGSSYWASRCGDAQVRKAWRGRELEGDDASKAVGASKVNLNVLRTQNKNACNMRTFEIPACGGFMLHERSRELSDLFRPGFECDDFGSPGELQQKVTYYLEHPKERARIAAAGLEAGRRQTYKEWAARVLSFYEER